MSNKPKIFLTGAAGCVGRRVTAQLLDAGYEIAAMLLDGERETYRYNSDPRVSCVIGNLEDFDADIVEPESIIVHLAAHVHIVPTNEAQEKRFFDINTDGTAALASAAAEKNARGFINISTLAVYGSKPCGDGFVESDTNLNPNTAYGKSKLAAEQELKKILPAAGVPHVSLRPAVVYGPGDRGNFLKMIKAIAGGSFPVIDSGRAKKTTLYVDNLAKTILFFVQNCSRFDSQVFNVADPEPKTMREIAQCVAEVANADLKIRNLPSWLLKPFGLLGDMAGFLAKCEMPISSRKIRVMTSDTVVNTDLLQEAFGGEVKFLTLAEGLHDYLESSESPIEK